ncbi:putative LOC729966 homolog isoform X2 [Xiphophorus hellerii]|uniref:putative LOC729966 homolog isoform X2 n=1 Tax=Xiphophorus hellerii TaxID=8084 RepID=UPI0013B3C5AE|nr:cell wall protein DAN4-like isoform X2 [Xiphophorus hellerii]
MPAAMHLTVLLSLLTATACEQTWSTVSSTVTATSASHATQSLATSSTVKTSTVTPQLQTTTQMTTSLTSASPQTATAEKTGPSSAPLNTTTSQTSNQTVTQSQTTSQTSSQTSNHTVTQSQTVPLTSESLNVTAGTSGNQTSSDLSGNKENYNLAENPGLVAVICIFTIVFGLLLVVMMVKCVKSSRSDFERLEDVPMGKVNEASPFAQYTK